MGASELESKWTYIAWNETVFMYEVSKAMEWRSIIYLNHSMTKPTKWHMHPAKTQISLGIHPDWSESSLCAQWEAKDSRFFHADSKDSDQTGWMPRLIWVFAWHTCHFFGFVMHRLNSFKMNIINTCSFLCVSRLRTSMLVAKMVTLSKCLFVSFNTCSVTSFSVPYKYKIPTFALKHPKLIVL